MESAYIPVFKCIHDINLNYNFFFKSKTKSFSFYIHIQSFTEILKIIQQWVFIGWNSQSCIKETHNGKHPFLFLYFDNSLQV